MHCAHFCAFACLSACREKEKFAENVAHFNIFTHYEYLTLLHIQLAAGILRYDTSEEYGRVVFIIRCFSSSFRNFQKFHLNVDDVVSTFFFTPQRIEIWLEEKKVVFE